MPEHESWKYQGRQKHGYFGHGTSGHGDGTRPGHTRSAGAATSPNHSGPGTEPKPDTARNVADLATIIQTEAGGEGEAAMVAVGHVVLNRMRRNRTQSVSDVRNGFAHVKSPKPETTSIARSILNGTTKDPTGGATHFYSPSYMPREGQHTGGRDVKGGLEQVPGMLDSNGMLIRTYRPGFAAVFEQREVSGVPPVKFKFLRAPGSSHVR